jgi:hypothetical protein
MDIAIIEQAAGVVVSRVVIDTLNGYDPGPGLIAIGVDGQIAYAGCSWTEQDGFIEPPQPPIDPAEQKALLIAYAADVRWRKETGGIIVGGVPVLTDDRAQLKVAGARIAANADPEFTTVWDGADGGSYPIDAATVIAISNAVLDHINRVFVTYSTIKADILAGTITTREEIEAAFV